MLFIFSSTSRSQRANLTLAYAESLMHLSVCIWLSIGTMTPPAARIAKYAIAQSGLFFPFRSTRSPFLIPFDWRKAAPWRIFL